MLVDACLARLRVDARLDDDPILPSLDHLPDDDFMEVDTGDLVIDCPSVRDLPSAMSIVRESVLANQRTQKDVPTLRRTRAQAPRASAAPVVKYARWPVILCAVVATYFGLTAFLKSPLGAKPEVQHVVKASRAHIDSALQATKSLVRF